MRVNFFLAFTFILNNDYVTFMCRSTIRLNAKREGHTRYEYAAHFSHSLVIAFLQ